MGCIGPAVAVEVAISRGFLEAPVRWFHGGHCKVVSWRPLRGGVMETPVRWFHGGYFEVV